MRVCHISPGAPVEGPVWDESQNILRKMLVPGALHTMSVVFSDRQTDRKQPDGWNMTLRRGEVLFCLSQMVRLYLLVFCSLLRFVIFDH